MRKNWQLMLKVLAAWEEMQADVHQGNVARMESLLAEEWQELREAWLGKGRLRKLGQGRLWFEDQGEMRWQVAEELADVMVVIHSLWRMKGLRMEVLESFLKFGGLGLVGLVEVSEEEQRLLAKVGALLFMSKAVGVDLAEATVLKVMVNYQHYPPGLLPEWRMGSFMAQMREWLGGERGQMPDLAMVIGPTGLSLVDESRLSEGSWEGGDGLWSLVG